MAEHKESRAKSAMSGKKSSTKRTGRAVREMHIKRGKSGGYIVKHDLEPQSKEDIMNTLQGGDSNTEDHAIPDLPSMQAHIAEHMPENQDSDNEQVEPDQGGAMTAGGQ